MQHLLMLHGALGSSHQLEKLRSELPSNFSTHTLNFSGHGRTPALHHAFTIQNFAHEVLQWLNEHQYPSVDIFGYSMGGYVALWLSRFYPQRVNRIFTLGTKLKWNKEEAEREIKMLNAEKVVEKVPAFAQSLAERHGEHEWRSVMSKTALLMHDLAQVHLTDQDFVKIENKTLICRGTNDQMVTREESEYAVRLMKNAQYLELPNEPHPIEKMELNQLKNELITFFN